MMYFQRLLITLVNVYSMIILVRAVVSWVSPNPHNELYRILIKITEPVLGRIRRLLPMSGIDFSPFIVIVLLNFIKNLIMGV
ncbi:MAG: YggT family protein [Candidatus Cloacimonetes bacterium]|nr:YggT family protein [Candidatus Cloacimonadota bacterium]